MKWGYMNKIEAESKIRKYEEKTESEFESLKKKWEDDKPDSVYFPLLQGLEATIHLGMLSPAFSSG